jgi:WD40 repeat protein/tRNA A-37 threonylcarbamoyl transferase component Bud32
VRIDTHPGPEQLTAFALGKLSGAEAAEIAAHLLACDDCVKALEGQGDDTLLRLILLADTVAENPTPPGVPPVRLETAVLPNGSGPVAEVPEAVPDLPAGLSRHERYRVVRLLGQGGMGAVYEAEHRVMQRSVALKVIKPTYTADDSAVERFRREVRAAARLAHPNIVAAYDGDNVGETHFLVMEYVAGKSLASVLRENGPLPIALACEYVRQAALGLQHAHERGMVHRDVKPDNLMLTPDGTVKVLDFGLAALLAERRAGGLTDSNVIMGTPDYMAPEQAEDARKTDARSDVYSLGCTLYQLLTGEPPFPGETAMMKILAHREQPVPPVRRKRLEVSEGLARVVARLMAKKPEDRYPSAGEAARALAPFTQPAAPRRRRRWPAVALTLTALLVGLTIAGVVVYRIRTDQGELVITTESDDVEVVVKQGGKVVKIIDTRTEKSVTLDSGSYDLALKGKPEGLRLTLDRAVLTRGEKVLAKIERFVGNRPGPVDGGKVPAEDSAVVPKPLEVARQLLWPGRNNLSTSFSEDSRLCVGFALGSNAFRVWETETGKLVQTVDGLPGTPTVRFLPDGKQLLSSHADGTFRRWDLHSGKMLGQIPTTAGWPQIIGFTSGSDGFCSVTEEVRVWNLPAGKERFRIGRVRKDAVVLSCAPLSADGKRLLVVDHLGSEGSRIRIFDAVTGKQLLSKLLPLSLHTVQAWSPDGSRIVALAYELETKAVIFAFLDAETGEIISRVPLVPATGGSRGSAFSRDTRFFAAQYPAAGLIHLYDTRTGKLVGAAAGQNSEFSLAFAPNGRYLASGGQGEVVIYRLPQPAKSP